MVKQENQAVFVIKFFNAAGCTYFELPKYKANRQTTMLENERHYIKDRSVQLIKDKFPNPINLDGLARYIEENLKTETVRDCMSHFGVPTDVEERVSIFSMALAMQFQLFLDADSDDIDCAVASEYEKLLNGIDVSDNARFGARYKGDDVWLGGTNRCRVPCFLPFAHSWELHNSGSVVWANRKLVFVAKSKNEPIPATVEIPIPEVLPNKCIKIATDFEARSLEGVYVSEWEMQDSAGQNCFPNTRKFNVTIDVFYDDKKMEE